ncbi:MAG: preprotein translocase subunit SecY [Sulfobacillus thermosulfidooxidans]|uniref:Protein translocase subunit SecY n=1 Tax=Sulfobacillus thermotolerans TaxID=338644 RepID=A0ABM6RNN4_9FIRM|nr:preprotein translocase subunit SecY [Sulfobacillus sp. hq2]AUW92958.1 preprotein translocase subunit SecY [Sulfobacillus thermotolerans]MCY0907118.1 preprotein translocase subunit SecY [Sulfobacillus thermotolerans]POB11179.1 preprotein translocase subunit SecY [Sulfobacillus sp. hq2]PSR37220.1 MAG: preprotein translocase subunit SecY [Sulfobacillus thermosulfidooxidans]
MAQNMVNAFRSSQLNKRILFTLLMLVVFRVGAHIPIPGVHASVIQSLFTHGATIFALLNLFSGGATATLSIFALSIIPYINASIIMQLMTVVIPTVEEWSKEGEEGQKKMTKVTRWLALGLGSLQSLGIAYYLYGYAANGEFAYIHHDIGSLLLTAMLLLTGSTILMWVGEEITDKGVGNGISLLVFFGIISRLPYGVEQLYKYIQAGIVSWPKIIIFLIIAVAIIAAVVYVNEGQRKIPVQYPKRVVGRRMYQGQTTHLPIRVNQAGVIPVIFAISLLILPYTIGQFFKGGWVTALERNFGFTSPIYIVAEFLLVVIFTFFYTQVVFKVDDVADNLKKGGGYIPGIRPGRPTAEYLAKVSSRLTLIGALFLGVIAVLPSFVTMGMGVNGMYFGGTSLLIIVGVALDTLKQMQAQMLMKQYQGFMK